MGEHPQQVVAAAEPGASPLVLLFEVGPQSTKGLINQQVTLARVTKLGVHLDGPHTQRVSVRVHAAMLAHDYVSPQIAAFHGSLQPTVH